MNQIMREKKNPRTIEPCILWNRIGDIIHCTPVVKVRLLPSKNLYMQSVLTNFMSSFHFVTRLLKILRKTNTV